METLTGSQFWKESSAAVKSGKYEKWWKLSQMEKAWLIAVFETQDILQAAVDWVAEEERSKKYAKNSKAR